MSARKVTERDLFMTHRLEMVRFTHTKIKNRDMLSEDYTQIERGLKTMKALEDSPGAKVTKVNASCM